MIMMIIMMIRGRRGRRRRRKKFAGNVKEVCSIGIRNNCRNVPKNISYTTNRRKDTNLGSSCLWAFYKTISHNTYEISSL
jgi:hypothetical protein